MAEPLLIVRDLRTYFYTDGGVARSVDGVSFEIGAGETLGLVGESGCGKSVTALSLLRLIRPPGRIESGSAIQFDGKNLVSLDEKSMRSIRGARIAMVFQEPMTALNPVFTVGDQIAEVVRVHHGGSKAEARKRAIEMLETVGIPSPNERVDDYPHQLSGGMRQRVVIALALAANPRLVVADEPTTALDVSIQAQIIALLKRLCRDHGTAVMLITHDMGVIAETADRVAVMYAGRIVEIGPVGDVIHQPQHPYTRGLMGSIPSIVDEREQLAQIDGAMPRLTAIPAGCPFHPRCAYAFDRCRVERPELLNARTSLAACWLHATAESIA